MDNITISKSEELVVGGNYVNKVTITDGTHVFQSVAGVANPTVRFSNGLQIGNDSASTKLSVGTHANEVLEVAKSLTLHGGAAGPGSTNQALLQIINGGTVNLLAESGKAFTVNSLAKSVAAESGNNTLIDIADGSLNALADNKATGLIFSGPMLVNLGLNSKLIATDLSLLKGTSVLDSAALTIDGKGGVDNTYKSLTIDGAGAHPEANTALSTSSLTVSGKDTQVNVYNGGSIVSDTFHLDGGTLNVGNGGHIMAGTKKDPITDYSAKSINLTKGTVNLQGSSWDAAGRLQAYSVYDEAPAGQKKIDLAKSAKFTLGGGSNTVAATLNAGAATLTVAAGQYGIITTAATTIGMGGLLSVASGGQLTIADNRLSTKPEFKFSPTHPKAFKNVALRLLGTRVTLESGSAMNIQGTVIVNPGADPDGINEYAGSAGGIVIKTGGLANINGTLHGSLTMEGGTAKVRTLAGSVQNPATAPKTHIIQGTGSLIADTVEIWEGNTHLQGDGILEIQGTSLTILGKDATGQFFTGGAINLTSTTGGLMNLGDTTANTKGGISTAKITITGSNTGMQVNAGTWTVDTVAQSSGSLTVQGGSTLNVASLNQTGGFVNVGANSTGGKLLVKGDVANIGYVAGSAGVAVNKLGVLEAQLDKVVNSAKNDFLNTTNQKQFFVDAGGMLVLKGGSGSMSLDQVKALNGKLVSGGGTVKLGDIDITVSDTDTINNVADAHAVVDTKVVKAADMVSGSAVVGGLLSSGGADMKIGTSASANLTLTGQAPNTGGQLVQGATASTKYELQNGSSLTLGNVGASGASTGTLTGSVGMDANGGALNAANGTFIVTGDITTTAADKGTVTAANATLKVNNIGSAATALEKVTVTTAGTVNAHDVHVKDVALTDGSLTANALSVATGGSASIAKGTMDVGSLDVSKAINGITVGDANAAGTLNVKTLALGGKTLFADPAWSPDGSVVDSAKVAIEGFSGGAVDGPVIAGQNSHITLGLADKGAWMDENIKKITKEGRLSKDGISAAMGIYKPMTLAANGSLTVDGTLIMDSNKKPVHEAGAAYSPVNNSATFADKSLLAVYATNMGTNTALTAAGASGGKLTVESTSRLMVVGGNVGDTVHIVKGFTDATSAIADKAWSGDTLLTGTNMILAERVAAFDKATGSYDVKLSRGASATQSLPLLQAEMAHLIDAMIDQNKYDPYSNAAGIKFLSRAVSSNLGFTSSPAEAAATIEGAAQLAAVGATQGMTMSAVNAATTAVTSRTSFASPLMDKTKAVALNMADGEVQLDAGVNAGDGLKNGVGLWIMPLYQSNNVWGMKSGEFKTGYTSDLGGVALGADYTFAEAFRIGLALNMGGGYAQSRGDFSKTDNSFNFWGIGLYGGWSQNNFGITADVGYTGNYNKVKQELPSTMQMGDIKADVTSSAITAGLRGEYKIETDVVDIIPHVSVRYTSLMTDGYDAKSNGTVFETDSSSQSIWTFPIGVTFTKGIESSSGWVFKPQLDLQVIPAAGDVKAKSNVRVPGIDASAELKTRVMDDITYGGGVGFDVQKDNVSFGINYNIQASEHATAHGVFGTFRYEF